MPANCRSGHALYVGLGGYVAALLWLDFGVGPWLGVFAAVAVAASFGAVIGWLGFRFRIEGVYFALLTIAFAEFTRIGFDNMSFTGGAAGLFLPFEEKRLGEWWNLRGGQVFFYYLALMLAAGAVVATALLARSRLGYQWLAVREDETAARAVGIDAFRVKLAAVVISSAMTAVGGVFYAFYNNSLFPAQVFDMSRSIELILAPIVGGLGTVFGPVIGAFILTPLGEGLIAVTKYFGVDLPGLKAVFYGAVLIAITIAMPDGRMAAALRAVRAQGPRAMTALLAVEGLTKRFAGLLAVDQVSFEVAAGEIFAVIGPNGAGKTTLFAMIAGAITPDEGAVWFDGVRIDRLTPDAVCRRGIGRTFQIVRPFPALSVEDNVAIGAALRRPDMASARAHARDILAALDLADKRDPAGRLSHACRTASVSRSPARSRPARNFCCSTR